MHKVMALIVLYLLSAIFVFIKIEPLIVAGVFLNICYLPGLCIFALGKRNKIIFEDLILAFPCSVGVSSVLILGLLFLGIHINHIPIIILTINGIAVFLFIIDRKKYTAIEVSRQELLFSLFALSIILLLSIPFSLGPNRVSISGHAFHHSVMVSQIINGIFPPENPGLGGTIIGYYWGFHALIATLTVKTNVQQIQIMFILNVVALFFIFCISYCFAKAFDLSEVYCYILPLAVMGLMRTDAGILFLVKLYAGKLISFEKIAASPIDPHSVLQNWISGLSWIDTRLFILRKLYNISGMLLAINLCYAYLLVLVRILKNNYQINRIYIIGIALIISACFFNYPPLAIFLLFHVSLWTCYIFLSSSGNLKEKIMEAMKIALPFIASVIVVSPYLLYVINSRDISSGSQGGIFSFDFYDQSLKNMVVFLIPLPVIAYGAWTALKKMSFSREFYFLFISTALCLTLTIFTRWPFDNSYKYNYILLFFFALFFVFAISRLLAFIGNSWLKRLITTFIIFFLLLPPILVEATHIVSAFSTDHIYAFPGKHITYAQDSQKNEAYIWIRENTPVNVLLMLSYVETNWPCCAFNNNYEPAAIAERTLYVIKDEDYTISNPEYAKRVAYREKLFTTPEDISVNNFFSELNRPVYLLVEDNLDEERFFVEERFKHFPEKPGRPFLLTFKSDLQRVYLINITK